MATKSNRKKQSLPSQLFKHFNTGISYFLPVIIAGGMLFSFTLITGKIDNGAIVPSNQFFQNIYDIGQAIVSLMNQLNGTSTVIVGLAIGLLAAADFGGPCSKAATAFTLALMAEGIYGPNGAFRMCCAIPPLGMALASLILKNKYDKADRQLGISALFLSSAGITEGAIPFAGKDFKHTWIACAIGTSIAGALAMLHNVSSVVAFGGIVAISGVFKSPLWYIVDMLIGAGIIVLILAFTKPNLEEIEK